MNGQNSGERFNNSDVVDETNKDTHNPGENPDPVTNKISVDPAPIRETPTGGTDAAVSPLVEAAPSKSPMGETITRDTPIGTNAGSPAALLNREESEHFRTRWNEIQGMFVDEPRSAVQQADALVSEVIENLTQMFAKEHSSLESQWNQGNDVSTEDLRKTLQRYRSFFNRLVV